MRVLRLSAIFFLFAGVAMAEAPGYFPNGTPIYMADDLIALWQDGSGTAEEDLDAPAVVQGTLTSIDCVPYESMGISYFDNYYNSFFELNDPDPISGEFPRMSLGDFDAYLLYSPGIDISIIEPGYEVQVLCHPFALKDGKAIADCRLVGYSRPEDTEYLTWQDMNTYIYLMNWNAYHRDGREEERQLLEEVQDTDY